MTFDVGPTLTIYKHSECEAKFMEFLVTLKKSKFFETKTTGLSESHPDSWILDCFGD